MVHGNGGSSGEGGWLPYVKRELVARGFIVHNPTMPDNVEAKSSIWLPCLRQELKADEQTIVIGHSSGAVAALRLAEQQRLYGSILVGACHTDLGEESERISGYYDAPWDWARIRANQHWVVQFASSDDPFIPVSEPRFIHEQLGSEYHEYTDRQHFGWPTEMLELPEVVEAVVRKVGII